MVLYPERLQGSQQLFPWDPIINGARQLAQTIGMAHFSIALLQCHWPSSTPISLGWSEPRKQSSTERKAVGRQPNPSPGGRRFTPLLFIPGLNPAWQSCATSTAPCKLGKGAVTCGSVSFYILMSKEHVLNGCFFSLMDNRAPDISL